MITSKYKKLIEEELTKFELTGEDRDVGRVLLGSLHVGPSSSKLAQAFGLKRAWVRTIGHRLRENGVWKGRRVRANWFEKDGAIGFLLDINIGLGFLKRAKVVVNR